jgi:hypothetical protein
MRNPKKEQDLAAINQEIKKLSRLLSTKSWVYYGGRPGWAPLGIMPGITY